jgi:hypothetical protein
VQPRVARARFAAGCSATIRMGLARQSGWESEPSSSLREGVARP